MITDNIDMIKNSYENIQTFVDNIDPSLMDKLDQLNNFEIPEDM